MLNNAQPAFCDGICSFNELNDTLTSSGLPDVMRRCTNGASLFSPTPQPSTADVEVVASTETGGGGESDMATARAKPPGGGKARKKSGHVNAAGGDGEAFVQVISLLKKQNVSGIPSYVVVNAREGKYIRGKGHGPGVIEIMY